MQNYIKTILSAVKTWTTRKIKESTADWNQNDSNANGYVKNRTHWEEEGLIYNLDKKTHTFPRDFTKKDYTTGTTYELCATNYEEGIKLNIPIEKDQEYIVCFDEKEYKLKCEEAEGSLYLGWDYYGVPTDEHEFGICCNFDGSELIAIFTHRSDTNQHTVAVYRIGTIIHKLDSKYLDLPENIATTDDVQGALDLASEAQSTANTAQNTANAKMSAENPVGTGSFSMNRSPASTVGNYSHAEGYHAIAEAAYSHAEGFSTIASGSQSHAEGYFSQATGYSSHAEGNSFAFGACSHAEGNMTIASSPDQHAEGRNNIEDAAGKYAHIVGNGASAKSRANAHTLDWDGNAWYSGDVYVGSTSGTNKDEGSKKLATEEFVKNKIAEAELSGEEVDLSGYAQKSDLPTKVSQLTNDIGYAKTSDIPTKPEDIGAQPSGNYALKSEIPTAPVQSVNNKTGAVVLSASDVGARPSTWTPTYSDVGADKSGTASSAVSTHNTKTDAHNDIRLLISGLTTRLDALANSDDDTLDQMAEVVAYIKANRDLIDQITTGKVSVTDIVNNLTTNVSNKPLSAGQGVEIKSLIDGLSNGKLDASALPTAINTALAQAKASGEFDGTNGKNGVSIKSVRIEEVI